MDGLFREKNLDPAREGKYEVLKRVSFIIKRYVNQHDMEFFLTDEAGGYPGGLYKKTCNWAVGSFTPQGRKAKIIVSDKAIEDLSDLAFEGLLYHESTRMLLFNEATGQSRIALRRMEGMPRPQQDARVYSSVGRFFAKAQGLVPFKVETGNIDHKEGNIDIGYWQEYLAALSNLAPDAAAEILKGLEFKNEL